MLAIPLDLGALKDRQMGDEKGSNKKQPGEKQPGKFDYNPVNMSGQKAGIFTEHDE